MSRRSAPEAADVLANLLHATGVEMPEGGLAEERALAILARALEAAGEVAVQEARDARADHREFERGAL